jgi:predicted amidohydrolase YtcJ
MGRRVLFSLIAATAAGAAIAASQPQPQPQPMADLIVYNARIYTINAAQPEAAAVAVLGDRIVAVGSDADVLRWRGAATHALDARGKLLLPGFNDAHVHLLDGGVELDSVHLNDANSVGEFARRIGEFAATRPPGEWLLQGNWDETKWSPAALPTRQVIDAVSGDHPVALWRYDGHEVVGNSRALALAGIAAATPDLPGGVIVRDAAGEPTGVLKDAATSLLERIIPAPTPAQRRTIIERVMREAAAHGVTSVQAMSTDYPTIAALADLLREGKLTLRVYAVPAISTVEDQAQLGIGRAFGAPLLRIGALKAFADGSLGSRTAYFFEPFDDQPDNRGLLSADMQPRSKMRDWMMRADATNLQLCTHAIGDAGISAILDIYQEIEAAHGARDRRWRIEHAQHMAERDFDRFAKLGVIASVQPYHAIDDGRWAEARIGHDRSSRTYAFKTFIEHGVRLALGTDWPVAPLDPMLTLYAATTRATLDGQHPGGWFPEQKLSAAEAITAYTLGSAYAEFQEHEKGSIEPGKLADFVLLSADILKIPAETIRNVRVLKTWVGGVEVYDAARAH